MLQLEDYQTHIKIMSKTDNSYFYDAVHSLTKIIDESLWNVMAILRKMIDIGAIVKIAWIPTDRQIADALTKKGVPSFKILGFTSELKGSSI